MKALKIYYVDEIYKRSNDYVFPVFPIVSILSLLALLNLIAGTEYVGITVWWESILSL